MRSLDRLQPLALLVLRIVLGAIMVRHGYHKVFGGMSHITELVGHLGLQGWLGYVSAGIEFFGGAAVLLGLFTRPASAAVLINLLVIWKVHWRNALIGPGGNEYTLALVAIAFALAAFGAGPISLDTVRGGSGGWSRKAKSR